MSATRHSGEDADIDLGGLFRAIWRRRLLVLMSTVVIGGIAFAGASVVSPKYQSEARVLIETRSPDLARRPTDVQSADPVLDDAGITSQVALLQSADLIRQVARDFKLNERPEFDPAANPSIVTKILVMAHMMKNPLDVEPEDRVISEFVQKLQVYQVEKSRVIAIQFSSKDPKLAAAIPNAMAKVYLSLQAGAKLDTTNETAKWLEPEIANLREKVNNAESKVAQYRSSSDLFKTGQQNTFSEQQLTDISQELARVRGDRATAEARAESVRQALSSGRNVDTVNEVVGSQMIQRLKETQSGIEGQIADLSTKLLDGHPQMKGLRSQLAGIRVQIRQETQKILSSLTNEANVAKLREQQLVQQLNSVKADSANTDEKQVGLNALEREATAQRQLLETYLARYREAVSEQDMNATPADARIVSQAVMPTQPYFPKTVPIVVVASLAGFVLSSVFILLSELFSGRAIRQVEYEDEDEVDAAEEIADDHRAVTEARITPAMAAELRRPAYRQVAEPQVQQIEPKRRSHSRDSLLSMADDDEELQDSMLMAAASQLQADDDNDHRDDEGEEFSIAAVARHLVDNRIKVAVSVSLVGDSGSAATVALARTIAATGNRIILIDMTGSALPTMLMAESSTLPGITNLLIGDAAFAETIHADHLSDAHILPQGTADARRAMRGADRLAMIVDALANAYDVVLVECGEADVAGVSRLARNGEVNIILSAAGAPMDEIEDIAGRFIDAGYEDVVLLFGDTGATPPSIGRKAA